MLQRHAKKTQKAYVRIVTKYVTLGGIIPPPPPHPVVCQVTMPAHDHFIASCLEIMHHSTKCDHKMLTKLHKNWDHMHYVMVQNLTAALQ